MKVYLVAYCLFVCISQSFGAEEEKLVTKTYPVGDLMAIPLNGSHDHRVAHTLELITKNVMPKSWSAVGGQGTVEYFPLGLTIVVNQTAEGHKEIEAYLRKLRKDAEKEEKAKK